MARNQVSTKRSLSVRSLSVLANPPRDPRLERIYKTHPTFVAQCADFLDEEGNTKRVIVKRGVPVKRGDVGTENTTQMGARAEVSRGGEGEEGGTRRSWRR